MIQQFQTLDGETSNCKVAATAIAIDVPLDPIRPSSVTVGDGISGIRVIWHFQGASKDGNTIHSVIKAWSDHGWQARNPDHEVTRINLAFNELQEMASTTRGTGHKYRQCTAQDTIKHASTALAATMVAIGHECLGFSKLGETYFWHFNRAAAADFSLWTDAMIHEKLPNAMLSYVKCALLNWKELLTHVKNPEFTAVKHGGRTAFVGKNDDAKTQSILEKLLYRK